MQSNRVGGRTKAGSTECADPCREESRGATGAGAARHPVGSDKHRHQQEVEVAGASSTNTPTRANRLHSGRSTRGKVGRSRSRGRSPGITRETRGQPTSSLPKAQNGSLAVPGEEQEWSGMLIAGLRSVLGVPLLSEHLWKYKQGLRILGGLIKRLTRGECAFVVHCWYSQMVDIAAATAQMEMERQMARRLQLAGVEQIKSSMARMAKGHIAVVLMEWRRNWVVCQSSIKSSRRRGLDTMAAAIGRIARGEVSRLWQSWKLQMADAAATCAAAQCRDTSSARLRTELQCAGVKQLKMVMARMVKRQIAAFLIQWHSAQQDYVRVLAGQKLGMNMIGATIIRMATGECTHAVQCWKVNMTEERMIHGSHCAGVKQLKMVMARMVKRQIAVLLIQWRNALHCHKQIFQAKKHGFAMIGATITRMAKGECAYLFRCWKVNMMDTEARYIQAELEQRMIQDSHSAGLKQLKLVMARMIKGVLGVAVNVWHAAQLQDEQIDTWSNLLQSQSYGSELEGVLASVRQEMEAKEQQLHSLSALQVT